MTDKPPIINMTLGQFNQRKKSPTNITLNIIQA